MNIKEINNIKNIVKKLKTKFTEEELNDKTDYLISLYWLFYDINKECDNILKNEINFEEKLRNLISVNFNRDN